MPGTEPTILTPLQTILRWGLLILVVAGAVAALAALVRFLARRWQSRARDLGQRITRELAALETALSELKADAAPYPPDLPAPYGPVVQKLQEAIASVETAYRYLTDQMANLGNADQELPEAAWDRLLHWFWRDPRHWWQRRAKLSALVRQLEAPQQEVVAADTLLKDLRRQPLDTAERARELYELVDTAQHTAGLLRAANVHGEELDTLSEALTGSRKTLSRLPIYLFACTESQIVRRAEPTEIVAAWETAESLDKDVRAMASRIAAWHAAYTTAQSELEAMAAGVAAAQECLQAAPGAVDTSDLSEAWAAAQVEADALATTFNAPSTEDLGHIDWITRVSDQMNQIIASVGSLTALHSQLASSLSDVAVVLQQLDQQLRQLAEAGRYPLDRVPLQATLDQLAQRYEALAGEGPAAPIRTAPQLEEALEALEALGDEARALVARVAEAREQRRHLIELLDQRAHVQRVDWMAWAEDLHQRTQAYTEDNWSGGGSLQAKLKDTFAPWTTEDLRVHAVLDDAKALAERQVRWIPASVEDPLAHDALDQRADEVQALYADIDAFQDRLDKITQRFQHLQETEERTKAVLATAYGAVDRLDMVAADVLPPALTTEDNHWSRSREQLDDGYELELALSNPSIGTVAEKEQRVNAWIRRTHDILQDWEKALDRETKEALGTLSSDLDELASVAPLDEESSLAQAREVVEQLSGASRAPSSRRRTWTPRGDRPAEVAQAADATAEAAVAVGDRLRTLTDVDEALTALRTSVIDPLIGPIRAWREAEQAAEGAFSHLQQLEGESAGMWPPVSCDTGAVRAQFAACDRIRDRLYQNGKTVTAVLDALTTLTEKYTAIAGMVEERQELYHQQRPELDQRLRDIEHWCTALEHYRAQYADDPVKSAAVRARLDEIEAGWTQLQIRYDQATELVPGGDAMRDLANLWRQARRDLPLGPGQDTLSAGEIEAST